MRAIVKFDSASAAVLATARFLKGRDFRSLGLPAVAKPLAFLANLLPEAGRRKAYAISGAGEAISSRQLRAVREEDISRWIAGQYPRGRYPAVAIGSSNGAMVHICAALGIPYLPQNTLVLVRRRSHPDDLRGDMEWGRAPGGDLLRQNPNIQLHHMHDPNQDRLMVQYVAYFRLKRRRLGHQYEAFLKDCLAPGGTIYIVESQINWPVMSVGEKHFFQSGGIGGMEPEEYLKGGERVASFLRTQESDRTGWDCPKTDCAAPEAEWGFEPALHDDIQRFSREQGYRVKRLVFGDPDDLSPLAADLYQWWYAERGHRATRLIAETFVAMDPWWVLRTGAAPFWMKFGVESSATRLESYLDQRGPFEEIHIGLLPHGVRSIGWASPERWHSILQKARSGALLGLTGDRYPSDLGFYARFHPHLRRIPLRHPIPAPLPIADFEAFLEASEYSRFLTA